MKNTVRIFTHNTKTVFNGQLWSLYMDDRKKYVANKKLH